MKLPSLSESKNRRRSGFTLVEMLVVITIIVILAALSFVISSRTKLSAAKVTAMNQMRSIGTGAAMWAADNASVEPFYFANGTGTYPYESGGGSSAFAPGNPAMALYKKEDPDSGYITDRSLFFSPLAKHEVPSLEEYDPSKASSAAIWGTYAWVHPFVESSKRTGRQLTAIQNNQGQEVESPINPGIAGRFLMCESYDDANFPPKFGKKIFHALMIDGSVQYVADSQEGLSRWRKGQ